MRRENTADVLKEKKLILVLDLDNTLLHSVEDGSLSSEDEYLIQLREFVEDDRDRSVFRWSGMVTKLRPRVRAFLKQASAMYDMYVYTMGSREYASQMTEFLDPEGVYFKNKVLSREDCTAPNQKGLDVVLGEERAVVIIDDSRTVWRRHTRNQIEIKAYHFFGPKRPILDFDGNPLSDTEELESKHSALDNALGYLKRIHWLFFRGARYHDNSDGDVRRVLLRIADEMQQE
ncbi:uncharacterized protein A4U43_C07F14360 [Asparagus officinalis]|uniref:RNA polymerase II C-terminal domain phosphatase-like n=1 Tax=Asparagus officinalis TaxID=4686 RepID=A0A5P1EDU9_ASPOF|nr:RNA polymerase II C-terminal domain phosphatase-like 4 [Asparagus officinalis]ONK63367.1 uncharacterized protein A4U43_C07F14360 [Asparagus officinalis]